MFTTGNSKSYLQVRKVATLKVILKINSLSKLSSFYKFEFGMVKQMFISLSEKNDVFDAESFPRNNRQKIRP
jgi:hypothetical protein